MFDNMTLKHAIQWNENNHSGFNEYDNNTSVGKKKVETQEVVVFLLVSLKGIWKRRIWTYCLFFHEKNVINNAFRTFKNYFDFML